MFLVIVVSLVIVALVAVVVVVVVVAVRLVVHLAPASVVRLAPIAVRVAVRVARPKRRILHMGGVSGIAKIPWTNR